MRNELVLAAFWYPLLVVWLIAYNRATHCLREWNVSTFFLLVLLLHHGVGVPFSLTVAEVRDDIVLPDWVFLSWLLGLSLMYAGLLVGAAIANATWLQSPGHFGSRANTPNIQRSGANPLFAPIVGITVGAVVIQLYRFGIPENFVAILLLSSTFEEYMDQRLGFSESIGTEHDIGNYFIAVAANAVFPIAVFYSMFRMRKSRWHTLFFAILVLLAAYRGIVSGHKSMVVLLFVGIFIAHQVAYNKSRLQIGAKGVALAAAGVLVVLPTLFLMQYSDIDYWDALYSAFFRICIEPNRGLQMFFLVFPDMQHHLGGASSVFIANLLDERNVIPPHTLIPEMFGARNTTWNVVFIGDAWADFGWFGIVSHSVVLGALLQWTNHWFSTRASSAFGMAAYVSLIVVAHKFAQVSLLSTLIGFGVVPIIVFYIVCNDWIQKQHTPALGHQTR